MNKKLSSLAAALLLSFAMPAQAARITFKLDHVRFSDGATARGWFDYDLSTRVSSNFHIATTEGLLTEFLYTNANSHFINTAGFGPNSFLFFSNDRSRYINLSFSTPLADRDGFWPTDVYSYECTNCSEVRWMYWGSVYVVPPTEVPEPGTLALLLPSLGVIGLVARRRKQLKP